MYTFGGQGRKCGCGETMSRGCRPSPPSGDQALRDGWVSVLLRRASSKSWAQRVGGRAKSIYFFVQVVCFHQINQGVS